ncbi:MAG: hypothetical protein AM324_007425 [Candidatus Thorarchaeota archaeon SMTZ1-83]|nr:MAG: hypothetical protein AM324_08650 [Candidatus Thorarchaeota archaeon SMTZ1-83]
MKLPICVFDIESDMLCPNCQERLDRGDITDFDVKFSRWFLNKSKEYPEIEDLHLLRAIESDGRLILVVRKDNKDRLLETEGLMNEIAELYGEVMIFEGPIKMRRIVRNLIDPAMEVGVNSLYLPDGTKESIVMLKPEDRDRITYSKEDLRKIVSAVMGESVLFQYQDERAEKEEGPSNDIFGEKLKEFAGKGRRR